MQLTIQQLQHRLKVEKGPRAVKDDVEIVVENNPWVREEDDGNSNDNTLPYPRDFRRNFRDQR